MSQRDRAVLFPRCCVPFGMALLLVSVPEASAQIVPAERRLEWRPGVPGGIPEYPVQHSVSDFGAIGDGATDDSGAFRDAIAATDPEHAVWVPEGSYLLTGSIDVPSHVVVRGAGPDQSQLIIEHSRAAFGIGDGAEIARTSLATDVAPDSNTLTVADAAGIEAGSFLHLSTGDGLQQMVRVESVDEAQVTLEGSLYSTYSAGVEVVLMALTEGAGVEDLFIRTAQPEIDGYSNSWKVRFGGAARSWARNIEGTGYVGIEVFVSNCYQCEVRDSYFHQDEEEALSKDAYNIYGIEVNNGSSDCLIENNLLDRYRHALVIQRDNGGGNVFGYNLSWNVWTGSGGSIGPALMGDVELHHERVEWALFEGNHVQMINAQNSPAFRHTNNTFLRNRITQSGIEPGDGNNYVGNELTQPKYVVMRDSWFPNNNVRTGEGVENIFHGNYTALSESIAWDPAIDDQTIPISFYRSERPAWFCDLEWPAFGGDLMPGNQRRSPAEVRFWSALFPEPSPHDLVVERLSETSVRLSWESASEGDVDFVIVRAREGEGFVRIDSTEELSFEDTSLQADARYHYYVRARNRLGGLDGGELGGESDPSNVASSDLEVPAPTLPDCRSVTPAIPPEVAEEGTDDESPADDADTRAENEQPNDGGIASEDTPPDDERPEPVPAVGDSGVTFQSDASTNPPSDAGPVDSPRRPRRADAGMQQDATATGADGCGCRIQPSARFAHRFVTGLLLLLGVSALRRLRRRAKADRGETSVQPW